MSAALKIPFRAVTPVPKADLARELTPLADALRSAFGVAFSFWCGESGDLLLPTHQQPGLNAPLQGELARVEVPAGDLPRLCEASFRREQIAEFRRLGFKFVTLDLEGFRSGSLNQLVQIQ